MVKNQYIASIFIVMANYIIYSAQSPIKESATSGQQSIARKLLQKQAAQSRFKMLFQRLEIPRITIHKKAPLPPKAPQPAPVVPIRALLEKEKLQQTATGPVLLYNANVPIERILITDINGTSQDALPHNPTTQPSNRAIWDIPINGGNSPYTLAIVANNKKYTWTIPSIHPEMGHELMISQTITAQGILLILQQFEELAADSNTIDIPITSETSTNPPNR